MAKDVIAELEARIVANISDFRKQMGDAANIVQDSEKKIKKHLNGIDLSFGGVSKSVLGFGGSLFNLNNVIQGMGITIFAKDLIQAGIAGDRFQLGLQAITGSAAGAKKEIEFVHAAAEKYGMSMVALEQAYTQFLGASKQSGVEMSKIRDTFIGVVEASSALGLSAEATKGIFLALSQMFSKGRISAEELRRQLGEHLPGAMGLMAAALGVSTAKLDKMMAAGELIANEGVPKLADAMHNKFGKAALDSAETARASFERFGNQIELLKRSFAESGFLDAAGKSAERLAKALQSAGIQTAITDIGKAAAMSMEGIGQLFTLMHDGFEVMAVKSATKAGTVERDFGIIQAAIAETEERIRTLSDPQYSIDVELDKAELEKAKAELAVLEQKLADLELKKVVIKIDGDVSIPIDKLKSVEEIASQSRATMKIYAIGSDTDIVKTIEEVKAKVDRSHAVMTIFSKADEKQVESTVSEIKGIIEKDFAVIHVTAKAKEAISVADETKKQIEAIQANILIGGNAKFAEAELARIKSMVEKEQAKISIGGKSDLAEDKIDDLVKLIQKTEAALKVLLKDDEAKKQVDDLRKSVSDQPAVLKVVVDTKTAEEQFDVLRQKLRDMHNETVRNKTEITGEGPGVASLETVVQIMDQMNAKKKEGIKLTTAEIEQLERLTKIYEERIRLREKAALDPWQSKFNPNFPTFASGTGLGGLAKDGPVFAHRGEIILSPSESNVFRNSVSNTSNRSSAINYSVTVNQQVVGDRPAMSAREMAAELTQKINQQRSRFGEMA